MPSLIDSRALPYREDEPEYPKVLARLAWESAGVIPASRMR